MTIIKVNDKTYTVYRIFKDHLNDTDYKDLIKDLKDFYGVTHVFQKDSKLFFCHEIEELPFEEILNIPLKEIE